MKKSCILLGFLLFATGPSFAQKVNMDIARTNSAPLIDGVEEELWDNVDAVPLVLPFGTETPTVTAYWKGLWDDDYIYILITVEDDNHYPSWKSGGNWWEYDHTEIYFDVNDLLNDGAGPSTASSGHYQFAPVFTVDGYETLHEVTGTTQAPGGTYACVLTGESCVYEQAIAIASMSNIDGYAMDCEKITALPEKIGFDVTVTDQDEGITTSRQRYVWQSGDGSENEAWNSMDACGTITLVGACGSGKTNVNIIKTTTAPVIDGIEDATWDAVTAIAINEPFMNENATVIAYWKGLWDDENLYILVNVADDNHYPSWEAGGNSSEYDKTDLYFDVNDVLVDGAGPATFSSGHYQFAPGFAEDGYEVLHEATGTTQAPGGTYAYVLTGEGYVYEQAITIASMSNSDGVAMDCDKLAALPENIGFDVTVTDQDEGITTIRQRLVWQSGTIDEAWNTMDDCGTIALVEPPPVPKVNVNVVKTAMTPVIDGVEEEIWDAVDAIAIDQPFMTEAATVTAYWKGLWDDDYVYILINVADDDHYPSWESGGNPWEFDRPELYFDVNDALVDGLGPSNASSGHYQFTPGFTEDGYNALHEVSGSTMSPGGTFAYSLTGEGYIYEQAIAISSMSNKYGYGMNSHKIASLPENIGFDVTVTDQDEGVTTARQRMVWQSGTIDEAWNTMDDCGTITLVEVPPYNPKINVVVGSAWQPIVIDGVEEAIWEYVDPVPLVLPLGTESPTVTAYWKAMVDNENIYVLISVEDDNHWPAWESGGNGWEYDKPEIYFDVNDMLNDGLGPSYASSGHYQFSPDFVEDGYGEIHEAAGTTQAPGGSYAYVMLGESYVYEYAVTMSSMSNKNGDAMECWKIQYLPENIGFDVTVIDQDEGVTTSRQRYIWQSGDGSEAEAWNSMDACGTISLAGGCGWINNSDIKTVNIAVHPNPAKDLLTLNADFDKVVIHSILGQEISSMNPVKTNQLDVGYLENGLYIVKVYKGEEYIGSVKIIKD